MYFYPRSPCGERPPGASVFRGWTLFLSTLSLRRATRPSVGSSAAEVISIHALLAESDISCALSASKLGDFYPRSPCGERRNANCNYRNARPISIHALLAESDASQTNLPGRISDFYPRSPCGERQTAYFFLAGGRDFYPRSPCGERQR